MNEKKRNYRPLALFLSVVLLVVGVVGGTYAWLIDQTETVENTFTYGDIDIKLEETKTDKNGNMLDKDDKIVTDADEAAKTTEGNEYAMIPGKPYLKNPMVTVNAGSEECWLFVKLSETGGATINGTNYGFSDYLSYTVSDSWNELTDEDTTDNVSTEKVYYVKVDASTEDSVYRVLKNDTIQVLGSVTKEMLNALDANGTDVEHATYPTLSVKAYAVQYFGFASEDLTDSSKNNKAAYNAWLAVHQ